MRLIKTKIEALGTINHNKRLSGSFLVHSLFWAGFSSLLVYCLIFKIFFLVINFPLLLSQYYFLLHIVEMWLQYHMKQNFAFICQKKSGGGQLEVVQWLEVIKLLLNQTWIHSPACSIISLLTLVSGEGKHSVVVVFLIAGYQTRTTDRSCSKNLHFLMAFKKRVLNTM